MCLYTAEVQGPISIPVEHTQEQLESPDSRVKGNHFPLELLLQKWISEQIKVSSLSNKIITNFSPNWLWECVGDPILPQLLQVCIILVTIYV